MSRSELLEIDRARELVLARAGVLPAEPVALEEALGRTVAEPVRASERVPGYDNSAMDGYAVRSADVATASESDPATLRLADESRAGSPAESELGAGEAIAISTGAAIPAGADAVIRVEDTSRSDGIVEARTAVGAGTNVRRAGEDIELGDELLAAGTTLGAAALGVLASIGCARPSCHRRPGVTVLSTGDELIGVTDELRPGAVRNSNAVSLPALARGAGAEVLVVDRVGDDRRETVAKLQRGLEADVLVVSGGVSVGAHDHVKASFAELGVEEVFWGVSLKPGKPTWFGAGRDALAFGLPGNPVSAFVTFLLFVRPALLAMQGADPAAVRTEAVLTEPYSKPADRAHAVRSELRAGPEGWLVTPAPQQGSHVMSSMLGADALALIPAATTRAEAGERVTIELLP